MEQFSALIQAVTIAVVSVFTSQINSLPLPIVEQNIPVNIISPEGKEKLVKTYGPFFDGKNQDSTVSMALTSPTPPLTPIAHATEISSTPTLTSHSKRPTPTVAPTRAPTPTNKPKPTSTPSPTLRPTQTPTPTLAPYVFNFPAPTNTPSNSNLDAQYIFKKVNEHRKSLKLASFEKDEQLCKLAAARAPEIYDEIYTTNNMHAGLRSRQIPYWINENIGSFQTEDQMINWWIADYIHRIAIEGNYKYSCVACKDKSCTQLFTSYNPK